MKPQPLYPRCHRSTGRLLLDFLIACLLFAVVIVLTSCGGTFTLRPDGTIGYTTPEILKAPIIHEK